MTCIVGFVSSRESKVYIGGDSAGSNGRSIFFRKDPKVFKIQDFLFGCTSSYRMIQIIRYQFIPPKISGVSGVGFSQQSDQNRDLHDYMATDFIRALRELFVKEGYVDKDGRSPEGGEFLVGFQNRLFVIDSDFQVGEHLDHFACVGSGADFAYGALKALVDTNSKMSCKQIVEQALKAASHFSTTVGGDFTIMNT